jgi:hypothetical protein
MTIYDIVEKVNREGYCKINSNDLMFSRHELFLTIGSSSKTVEEFLADSNVKVIMRPSHSSYIDTYEFTAIKLDPSILF